MRHLELLQKNEAPISRRAHESVARHYGVSTIDLAAEVAHRIGQGTLTWKQYGGTHPAETGNRIAADMIDDLFTTAWSRDQEEKIYVQHRLKEHGAEVWEWFDNGAYFYICGDKSRMAKDVHRALIEIAMEHGGMSEADATHFIEQTMMKDEKRYLRDVY